MGGTIVRCALVAGVLIALSPSLAQAQTADDLSALRKDIDALKEGPGRPLGAPADQEPAECSPARAQGRIRAPEAVLTSATGRRRARRTQDSRWSSSPITSDPSAAGTSVRRTPRSSETTSRPAWCGTSSATCRWNRSTRTPSRPAEATTAPAIRASTGRCTIACSRTSVSSAEMTWRSMRRRSGWTWGCSSSASPAAKHADAIRKDLAEAAAAPGHRHADVLDRRVEPEQSEMKATRLVGAQPYSAFKSIIDGLLAAPK